MCHIQLTDERVDSVDGFGCCYHPTVMAAVILCWWPIKSDRKRTTTARRQEQRHRFVMPTTAKTTTATRPWSDETTAPLKRRNSTVSWLTSAATFFRLFLNIPHGWIFYLLFLLVFFFFVFLGQSTVWISPNRFFVFYLRDWFSISCRLLFSFPFYRPVTKYCAQLEEWKLNLSITVHNNPRHWITHNYTGAARRRNDKWNKSLLL